MNMIQIIYHLRTQKNLSQIFLCVFLFPDHWHHNPVPTFALMETIRSAIDTSDTSYRKGFPPILDCLGLKHPTNLVGLISKIKRHVAKAQKTGEFISLCHEMPGLSKSNKEIIGSACSSAGIFPEWLENDDVFSGMISNQAIIELQQYRSRKDIPWKTVVNKWWSKLFPGAIPPPLGTVISSWNNLAARKIKITHNSSKEEKDKFLVSHYVLPVPRPPRDQNMDDVDVQDDESNTADDSGYDTSLSYDDTPIRYILRSHGDTIAILHELLEEERLENKALQTELEKEKELRTAAEKSSCTAQKAAKVSMADKLKLVEQHKKDCSKYKLELKKAAELSAKLEAEIRKLTASNVVRRLHTKTEQLEIEEAETTKLKSDVEKFKIEIVKLNEALLEKRRVNKNKTEQLRYHRLKRGKDQEMSEEENSKLRSQPC